jgi:hypothetical protein
MAGDLGPEFTDAVFPMIVYLPIEECPCMCSVLLKCSRLNLIHPVRGVVEACSGGPGTCHLEPFQVSIHRGPVTVSPSPQSKDEENEKLHKLRRYARDFRRQHTTDAEWFNWDSDDEDYGLAIGRLVVT